MNSDHTPKLVQSDLLCGSKSPTEKVDVKKAFSSQLSLTAHGMLVLKMWLNDSCICWTSYTLTRSVIVVNITSLLWN